MKTSAVHTAGDGVAMAGSATNGGEAMTVEAGRL
jgi:hypothetical protein